MIADKPGRGCKKTTELLPMLESDIRSLVDPNSQTHPTFETSFRYTRMTAKAVREALVKEKVTNSKSCLPKVRYVIYSVRWGTVFVGYKRPELLRFMGLKKIPETDAIFANVHAAHKRSDEDDETLRISIDTKAKIKLGEFSRGGKLRCTEPTKALDHDMEANGILVPFGILEVKQKQFNIVYGNSRETIARKIILYCRLSGTLVAISQEKLSTHQAIADGFGQRPGNRKSSDTIYQTDR